MRLRTRLALVILAVALPAGGASLLSLLHYRSLKQEVERLGPRAQVVLAGESIEGHTVEVEGHWDEQGHFVAHEVEQLPMSRRPKLRGTIQSFDRDGPTLDVHGQTISLAPSSGSQAQAAPNEALAVIQPGMRVEVSCSVDEDGRWHARKVETEGIKASDKVKGTVTRARGEAGSDRWLEIESLSILLPAGVPVARPGGPLLGLELTGQMRLSVQEFLAEAQGFLTQRWRRKDALDHGLGEELDALGQAIDDHEDRMLDERLAFGRHLEALADTDTGAALGDFVDSLEEELSSWRVELEEFVGLGSANLERAQSFLPNVIEPHLRERILPRLHSIETRLEEHLAHELDGIAERSRAAARAAVITLVLGLFLALALGVFLTRAISRSVRELEVAARHIAAGHFSTTVSVHSGDELGTLAEAFNRMSQQLATTVVSVERLHGVIDSMAGALFQLGSDARIVTVNPAAAAMLGFSRDELIGTEFSSICLPAAESESPSAAELVDSGERLLRAKGGRTLPAAYSGAALSGEHGEVSGYVCLLQDISERKRLEKSLRRSLSEKELLLREVHHRVKNNLQVISSLLDLQTRSISDPVALSKFQESQDRIRSLVLIHEQLYRARDQEFIQMKSYLELMATHLVQAHLEEPDRVHMRLEVEELTLDLDRALACGLIVNELVTNTFKHAFPDRPPGEIFIGCRRGRNEHIRLTVSDDGRGPDLATSDHEEETLGTSLIQALTRQLHGRLEREVGQGSSVHIVFPASRSVGVN